MDNGVTLAARAMEVGWRLKRDKVMLLGVAVGWHGSMAIVEAGVW